MRNSEKNNGYTCVLASCQALCHSIWLSQQSCETGIVVITILQWGNWSSEVAGIYLGTLAPGGEARVHTCSFFTFKKKIKCSEIEIVVLISLLWWCRTFHTHLPAHTHTYIHLKTRFFVKWGGRMLGFCRSWRGILSSLKFPGLRLVIKQPCPQPATLLIPSCRLYQTVTVGSMFPQVLSFSACRNRCVALILKN